MSIKPEAYVHLSEDQTALTFFYDAFRTYRHGTTWRIEENKTNGNSFPPAWTGDEKSPNTTVLTVVFDAWFRDFSPTTTAKWFYYLKSLKHIEGFEHLNTSQVTDMSGMFSGCESLTSLDLTSFDTSKVTDMRWMFFDCESLTALDLSSFNTSEVTGMSGMFYDCESLTALDLSSFNTSEVTDMSYMFFGCSSLTALNLSSFDTSKVAEMNELLSSCRQLKSISFGKIQLQEGAELQEVFSNCPSLTQITCHPDSQFNDLKQLFEHCALLKNVVDYHQLYSLLQQNKADDIKIPFQTPISSMLEAYVVQSADQTTLTFYYDKKRFSHSTHSWSIYECSSNSPTWQYTGVTTLKAIFTASFKDFHPTSTAYWFADFESLKHIEGLEYLDTSEVTDMSGMFGGCSSLRALDLSRFDTSQVARMIAMFYGCSSLTSLNLSRFDTSEVKDMGHMFDNCPSLTALDLSSFDTSQVKGMREMFFGCSSLTSLDLSRFDTSEVTDMSFMFCGCSSLTALDLSSFDISEVTNMYGMFLECWSLTTLDLSSFGTSQVADMREMFFGCLSLTTLDLSRFDTSKVTNMREMFCDCSSLTTIYSNSSWSCRYSNDMFSGCNSLRGAANFNEKYTDARMANSETGYFTKKVL